MFFKELLPDDWKDALRGEVQGAWIRDLEAFLRREYESGREIYPPRNEIFSAFTGCSFSKVRVVIMGQDPYHGPGQAHGLSFSVKPGVQLPPSLQNIYKEIERDLGCPSPETGCLDAWAKQGVMMLNATLTVRQKEPKSHYGKGWEHFTDKVIAALAKREEPVIFVLWGRSARDKCESVLKDIPGNYKTLVAPHPSPFSVHTGFFGCRHFSKINAQLKEWGQDPIVWSEKR